MPRQAGHDIRASGQAKPGRCGAASERPHREGDGRLGNPLFDERGVRSKAYMTIRSD